MMAAVLIYKRNETFVELSSLVEELSNIGLAKALKKYYKNPVEHEAKSIVAGPSFIQFLNKLFRIQIAAGDILQFESANASKYFMFSLTGTWDEIIELQ
jgi:proline dehydrogenase